MVQEVITDLPNVALQYLFWLQVERHSTCAELCLDYALGDCQSQHDHLSPALEKFHELRQQVTEGVERINDQQKRDIRLKNWKEVLTNHKEYLAHLIRTKHQGGYYQYILENLAPGEIVVIIDYKMKVELGTRVRENQREWYGKRGISLHGFFVIAQVNNLSITILFLGLFISHNILTLIIIRKNKLDIGL